MEFTKDEIYSRYKHMEGKEETKVSILAQLNNCPEKYIREIIKEKKATEPLTESYDPDKNPYCRVKTEKKYIPAAVLSLVYEELNILDREIKTIEDELRVKHKAYKELIEFLGGTVNE